MKRLAILALLFAAPLFAQPGSVQNHCYLGGTQAAVSGIKSTNYLDGNIPSCRVSVYFTQTSTLAPIFSAPSGPGGVSGVIIGAGGTYSVCPTGVTFTAGGGTGASGIPLCTGTAVTGVAMSAAGSGYTSLPTVGFTGGSGSGATGTATTAPVLSSQFTANAVGTTDPGGWIFWASCGSKYDVTMSGGIAPNAYSNPVTLTGVSPNGCGTGGGGGGGSAISVAATAPIQVNGGTGPVVSGVATISCQNGSCGGSQDLALQVIPPVTGQHVIIYPSVAPVLVGGNCVTVSADSVAPFSGSIGRTNSGALPSCAADVTATYTNFPLPSFILPANVTAIYGGAVEQVYCGLNSSNQPLNTCGAWSVTANGSQVGPTLPTNIPLSTYTTLLCSSCGSFNYSTAQFIFDNSSTAEWPFTSPVTGFSSTFLPFLIVYYTGTAPPTDNQVQVSPCLNYNQKGLSTINPCNTGVDINSLTTPNVYQATIPGFSGLVVGTAVSVQPGASNTTTTPTFSLNGGPALTIVGPQDGALCTTGSGGGPDIVAGEPMNLTLGLGVWELQNQRHCFGSITPVTWPANNTVVVSNATNTPAGIAPGTSGNALCSNGTTWVSSTSCVGGGGGGGSLIPSNAQFIFVGSSINDDDNHILSPAVAISSWSTTSDTTTVTTSAAHGFTTNDWVNMRFATSWPSPPAAYALGTNYTLFKVTVVDSTHFTISTSLISAGSCASSCGNVYSAMGYLPFRTASQQAFPSGSLNRTYMFLPANVSIQGLNSGFSAMFASSGTQITCPVSVPTYLVINNFNNDPWLGRSASQIMSDYNGIFSQAHTCGMTAVIGTSTATDQSQTFNSGAYTQWITAQRQLAGDAKSVTNTASGQYWDIGADIGQIINNAANSNIFNISDNEPTPGGFGLMSAGLANAMATGSGQALPQQTLWWGNIGDNESNLANGFMSTPSADAPFTWQWTNSANSARMATLGHVAGNNPAVFAVGSSATFPGEIDIIGDPGFGNNFTPVLQSIDLEANPLNSSVKNTVIAEPITPNADISKNNVQLSIAAIGRTPAGAAPSIAAGQGADLGFNYSSTLTPLDNSLFAHIAGDTLDSWRACTGGELAIGMATAETTGNPEGCPASEMLSVGWTGTGNAPFFVDSSGNVTLHNLTCTGTGCGGGSGISNITIAVTGATQGANTCSSPATATMTGLTTSGAGSHLTSAYTANPSALIGWGSTGGMVFQAWPSAANTVSWIVCNQTASPITFSSITFSMGAQ